MPTNDNNVELVGVYGSDETHALSAWTSTARELTEEKRSRMPSFLASLAKEGHHTPFEKSSQHFLVTCDIASSVHLLKHRIGVSVNSESARYKEMRGDKFYVPLDWPEHERQLYIANVTTAQRAYHEAIERLVKSGMSRKRAKESARFYLPFGTQYTLDVMFNFRSFNHFLGLRYSLHSQLEIRNIAKEMLRLVAGTGLFDESLRAFGWLDENGVIVGPRGA